MRKALMVILFGFSPVWAMLIFMNISVYVSDGPRVPLTSMPWLVVVTLLSCVVTLSLSIYALRRRPPADANTRSPED